jgi:hypothetical protein
VSGPECPLDGPEADALLLQPKRRLMYVFDKAAIKLVLLRCEVGERDIGLSRLPHRLTLMFEERD